MRKSAIAVVTGIIIVITLVMVMPVKPGGMPPIIQDQPELEDKVQWDVENRITDKPNLTDSADFSNNEEYEYYMDEEGNKNYIISAVDMPNIDG